MEYAATIGESADMRTKPRVLVPTPYFLPSRRGGGSVTSVRNLVLSLADEYDFTIVTRDRDLGADGPYLSTERLTDDSFPARVVYVPPGLRGMRQVKRSLEQPAAVLYLNSVFSPLFTGWPLALRKSGGNSERAVVLAPRGELLPGALRLKPQKKRFYIKLARLLNLYESVIWQPASKAEVSAIRDHFDPQRLASICPNIPTPYPEDSSRPPKPKERLHLLFLSRIARNKNLGYAIDVLSDLDFPASLTIAGPIEDAGYWRACKRKLERLPVWVRYESKGPVKPDEVFELYRAHDLFFMPTLGESYGHVIVEAMTAGCPVLISQRTPWRGLAKLGVGWDVPLKSPQKFISVLRNVYRMGPEQHQKLSAKAMRWSREAVGYDRAVQAQREVLEAALEGSASR